MSKICICFYGLAQRSLKYTIDSIETNIFKVLKDNNIEYDIYLHTYDASYCYAPRNNEQHIPVDCDDYKLLNPKSHIIESYDKADNLFNYKQYHDIFNNNHNSILNWIREMYSIQQVTTLWSSNIDEYKLYLYLRPDLMYVTPLPINYLRYKFNKHINKSILFTTPWGKSTGLNDFVGIGNYNAMIKWANRIDSFDEYMRKICYNAEKHILFVCDKEGIINIDLPMLFNRIRSTKTRVNESWGDADINFCNKVGCNINPKYLHV